MKKLLFLCIGLSLLAGKGEAQRGGYTPDAAEWKHRMALDAPQLYQKYRKGSALAGFGAGLTIGGVASIVVGIATADKETVKNGTGGTQVNLSGPGAGIFAAGMVCALAGTPLWIIGHVKKKNARNRYLRDYACAPYLQLNAVQNGLGLAFVF